MASFSNTPAFDSLLLQTLMNRLQLRPPIPSAATSSPSFLNQTLEDLLFDNLNSLSDTTTSDDDDGGPSDTKSQLSKEESRLEKSIIRTILSGEIETLKPNSGQAVTINEHHICVGFHQEADSGYRVWEWHGHIMLFDDENGYSPEYIYGNYFERVRERGAQVVGREREEEEEEEEVAVEEKLGSLGLRELIGEGDDSGLGPGRILHRNLNAGSSRF